MTVDIMDGTTGTPHIDADDWGTSNVGLVGPDAYVLAGKEQLNLTMESANSGTLATGMAMMWGRRVHVSAAETITVESGTQGMKRNDLLVLHYEKDTTGVETVKPLVVKGTPAETPADPAITAVTAITPNTKTADMPLYRISLDGITVSEPVPLFNVLKPVSDLWDSVSQLPRMFFGSKVISGGSNTDYTILTAAEITALTGSAWVVGSCFAAVMNADRLASNVRIYAPSYAESGLAVHTSSAPGGNFRISYVIVRFD